MVLVHFCVIVVVCTAVCFCNPFPSSLGSLCSIPDSITTIHLVVCTNIRVLPCAWCDLSFNACLLAFLFPFVVAVIGRVVAVDFHCLFYARRHGFRHGCVLGLEDPVDAGWLRQLEVSVVVDDHGPIAIPFRLFGHGDGVLPGLADGLVLFEGSFPGRGTGQAPQQDQRGVVEDQKGLQKVPKAGGEDAEQDGHRFADPQARRRQGTGVQGRQTDPGDSPQRRSKDREGKARGLAESAAEHGGEGRRNDGVAAFFASAGKVRRQERRRRGRHQGITAAASSGRRPPRESRQKCV
mmetsp:Transcript_26522/g.56840  ORF Transcript_26522/g.56840 Transcript_26522/m.56840 type:complete len:294 (-) Transcript_26522:399-1280(-)